jgi:hypothetical protein
MTEENLTVSRSDRPGFKTIASELGALSYKASGLASFLSKPKDLLAPDPLQAMRDRISAQDKDIYDLSQALKSQHNALLTLSTIMNATIAQNSKGSTALNTTSGKSKNTEEAQEIPSINNSWQLIWKLAHPHFGKLVPFIGTGIILSFIIYIALHSLRDLGLI